jgi:hypothetical protein
MRSASRYANMSIELGTYLGRWWLQRGRYLYRHRRERSAAAVPFVCGCVRLWQNKVRR